MTDEALLAGMAAGDADAATALVRRYQARVYGLALTIVGVAATAEDVAQDAFLRVWRFAGGYDPRRGAVATWLLGITRNAAIDALRLRRDQPFEPGLLLAMLDTGSTDDGPDRVADTDRIRTALHALPRDQATAVVMATFYGLTAREIAASQQVPTGTAKTRIRLGLARLRDMFEVHDG